MSKTLLIRFLPVFVVFKVSYLEAYENETDALFSRKKMRIYTGLCAQQEDSWTKSHE